MLQVKHAPREHTQILHHEVGYQDSKANHCSELLPFPELLPNTRSATFQQVQSGQRLTKPEVCPYSAKQDSKLHHLWILFPILLLIAMLLEVYSTNGS